LISQYIFFTYAFCSWEQIFLYWIQKCIPKVQDKLIIFINPQLIILYTKKEYITWALRFLTFFPRTLKIYPIMLGNLKLA
jgi:hypothetical protein